MSRVVVALGLFLAACASTGPERVAGFRAADAPIYSAAAFDPSRIAGRWTQVADFATGAAECQGGGVEFLPVAAGLAVRGDLCLNGQRRSVSGLIGTTGPGRLSVPGMEDWWIVWVDSGYRTLAVATPSGRFGFVLDRSAISGDRLQAAREVFDFNGYTTASLKPI